jgi:hypothetical protein
MRRARWVLLAALVLAAPAACGDEPRRVTQPAKTVEPVAYPVAFAVARDDLAKLAERPLPDAVEGAEVVATTTWEPYALLVLSEWLHERGIDLDPPTALEAATNQLGEAWDVPVFVITEEHARRYRERLARLRPDEAELRAYFEEFNEESLPEAGETMAEWLDIVRRSLETARDGRVVVIPIED